MRPFYLLFDTPPGPEGAPGLIEAANDAGDRVDAFAVWQRGPVRPYGQTYRYGPFMPAVNFLARPGDYLVTVTEDGFRVWNINTLSDTGDLRERFAALNAQEDAFAAPLPEPPLPEDSDG